jgi:hypothetical protein
MRAVGAWPHDRLVSYTLARAEQRIGSRARRRSRPTACGSGRDAKVNGGRWYRAPFDKTHDLSVVGAAPCRGRLGVGVTFVLASGLPATIPRARYADRRVDRARVRAAQRGFRLPLYHRMRRRLTRARPGANGSCGVVNVYNRYNAQSISFRQSERNPLVAQAVPAVVFGIVPSVSYTRRF